VNTEAKRTAQIRRILGRKPLRPFFRGLLPSDSPQEGVPQRFLFYIRPWLAHIASMIGDNRAYQSDILGAI